MSGAVHFEVLHYVHGDVHGGNMKNELKIVNIDLVLFPVLSFLCFICSFYVEFIL